MLDWLYGPRLAADYWWQEATLRNLTLDVETLFDASREIPQIVKRSKAARILFVDPYPGGAEMRELAYTSTTEYWLRDRTVSEDDIQALGTWDRGQITMVVRVMATEVISPENVDREPAGVKLDLFVESSDAKVRLGGDLGSRSEQVIRDIADYLYANASLRPHWRGAQWLAWLVPIPIALGAWLWLSLTNDVPVALHLLVFAVIVLSGSGAAARALAGRKRAWETTSGKSFRYRGESRTETRQRRADARSNVKVAFITALITAPIALVVGLLTGG